MAKPHPTQEHEHADADADAEAFVAAAREGIADAENGRTIPYEDVRRWLLSWGTESELLPPEYRQFSDGPH